MNIRTASRANLFLIELIIVILFFSLTAAVSVTLFAHSHTAATESSDLTMATLTAQTAIETMKNVNGDKDALAAALNGRAHKNSITVYYNDNWQPINEKGSYQLKMRIRENDGLLTAATKITKDKKLIYQIDNAFYIGEEAMP